MPAKKEKLPTRDINFPVLAFIVGQTEYHVLVAGAKDHIPMAHKGGKHNWSAESLIVCEYGMGLHENEAHLYAADMWGWFGRLMADRTLDVLLLTPSDEDIRRYRSSLDSKDVLREKARNYQGIYETYWFYGKRPAAWTDSVFHRERVKKIRERIEYLRGELRAERISYGELSDLHCLSDAGLLDDDQELLEAAGEWEPSTDK